MWIGIIWCAIGAVLGLLECFLPNPDQVVHQLILIERTVLMCLGYLIYRVAKPKEAE